MGKHFEEVVFFLFVAFFVWVFLAPTGSSEISRACAPVAWTGGAVTAISRALNTSLSTKASIASSDLDYRCKLAIWDFFDRPACLRANPHDPAVCNPGSKSS